MTLEIMRIDPFDAAAVDAWWDAYAAAERASHASAVYTYSAESQRVRSGLGRKKIGDAGANSYEGETRQIPDKSRFLTVPSAKSLTQ